MDLYRYFHPHHNPRLRKVPLRLQEVGELKQATIELRRAIKRAEIRTENAPVAGMRKEHFTELLHALDYAVETLTSLSNIHPGDDSETMAKILEERKEAPGWENWARLLKQRLQILERYDEPDSPENRIAQNAKLSNSSGI